MAMVDEAGIPRLQSWEVQGGIPDGDDWPRGLLEQMSLPIPGLRPPLLSGDTVELLNKFRAFRHVFRNIYGFQLDAGRTLELLRDLNRTVVALNTDLDRFLSEIDRAVL